MDKFTFPEWVKSLDFEIRISSYGSWKLDRDSHLNWELSKS